MSDRTMVGRDSELAEILGLIGIDPASAHAPSPDLLIAGDAGMGKSRLIRTIRQTVESHGWNVLTGYCLDFGDADLPYLPFSEIVGSLIERWPDAVEAVRVDHPALDRLQPVQRSRSPRTGGRGGRRPG